MGKLDGWMNSGLPWKCQNLCTKAWAKREGSLSKCEKCLLIVKTPHFFRSYRPCHIAKRCT